jgi:hypothetical protein
MLAELEGKVAQLLVVPRQWCHRTKAGVNVAGLLTWQAVMCWVMGWAMSRFAPQQADRRMQRMSQHRLPQA